MTTIPYQTHVAIRNAVMSVYADMHMRLRKMRLRATASPAWALDTSKTIWYFKDTKVDLVFSPAMGFIILDNVRRFRSPRIPTLTAALRAREQTMKDVADHEDAQRAETEAAGATPSPV